MINSRKIKGRRYIQLASLALVSFFIIKIMPWSSISVSANNSYDTVYQYTYETTLVTTRLQTEHRPKIDATSSYIYNNKSNVNVMQIHVLGKAFGDNQEYECTYGNYYKNCAIGERKYLENTVNEDGLGLASLWFDPSDTHKGSLNFLWSPDSI